jgi:RND family efflux transporter MFP subunit
LSKKRATSEDELARAETALDVAQAEEQLLRTRLGYMLIEAPFAGVVTERVAEPGDVVAKHDHLLTLADPASLVAEIQVSELLLPRLAVGDPVQLRIDAIGPGEHAGRILRIHPELDRFTRQGTIEVALEPIPAAARAGQFVRTTLHSAQVERLLVPFAAVRRDRQGEFVYLLRDGKAEPQRVHTGVRIKDQIEILDGLEAGNEVIARGFLGLTPGKKVQALEHGATSPGSMPGPGATAALANAPDPATGR